MKTLFRTLTCTALALGAGPVVVQAQAYHVAKTIKLPGEGGWDYLAFDSVGHRLFIARQNRIMVVDPESGKVLGEIPGLERAHGIAFSYETGQGFASSGTDSTVTRFDLKTLKVLGHTITALDDDAILYDPVTKRIFTFNGDANSASVLSVETGSVIGSIDLGTGPEYAVSAFDGKLYVNLEDKSAIDEIDAAAMKVTRQWSLAPCESPSGLAIDRAHHRLFSGCHNKVMAISDATAGKVITTVPIGAGVDANGFDPGTQLAFSSNGDGTLTVVHEDSPDKYSVVANVATKRGARTLALDERTHRVYLVTADFGPPPAPSAEHPHPRPTILPGTFTLIVTEP